MRIPGHEVANGLVGHQPLGHRLPDGDRLGGAAAHLVIRRVQAHRHTLHPGGVVVEVEEGEVVEEKVRRG